MFRFYSLFAALLLLSLSPNVNAQTSYMLDFVVMQDGYDLNHRDSYESVIAPMAAQHGMKKVRGYDLTQHLSGGLSKAVRLNIWEVPQGALPKLGQDPLYQTIVPYRDKIHNMQELSLFMAQETQGEREPTDETILVDLVVMNDGYGLKEREAYERRIAPIARRYGMRKFATYDIAQKIAGTAPEGLRLNLWAVPDPAAMGKLASDPDYQKHVANRDKIHQMEQLTLFFARQADL